MAGAGYKLFSTGDVLSASDVNTYLQQQTVMVFASAAARTTALASVLAEGMVTYLKDTDVVEIYTGAAWVSLDDPNAIQNSLLTAKGSIVTATGASTPSALAVGTNNQVLTADSTTATGLKWATPSAGGGGKVLQVVQGTTSTTATMSSSTPADTNLTATITPSASTSKILILCTQEYYFNKNSSSPQVGLRIMRDSTSIINWGSYGAWNLGTGVVNTDGRILQGFNYLDSPATTSAVTYKTQGSTNNTTTITFQETGTSTIILMEIGA